jgi:hypothetical protein
MEVCFIDSPFEIETLPLDKIYVLDNWLAPIIHRKIDGVVTTANWRKTNEVRGDDPTGLPMHQFWGSTMNRDNDWDNENSHDLIVWSKYLEERLREGFGFNWKKLDYMGLNSQTQGLYGTIHNDCPDDEDQNLSFLYYPNTHWEDHWGGVLRLYENPKDGIETIQGFDNRENGVQIAEVSFKPNRLIMFDGRIPHGADAPNSNARYMDRRSIVIRGDKVKLCQR